MSSFLIDEHSATDEEPWKRFTDYSRSKLEQTFLNSQNQINQIFKNSSQLEALDQSWTTLVTILYKPLQSITFDGSWKSQEGRKKVWLKGIMNTRQL